MRDEAETNADARVEAERASLLRPAYRNYVLVMVSLGMGFSFLDRQIVTILLPAIKADLHVSDLQLGLMSGLAFALVYASLGIPLASLADRRSRRNQMSIAIAAWSVMSVLGGLVRTFPQLVMARFGVGVGEAGYSPAAFSMISDYFTKERRQTAAAVLSLGPQLGVMLGLMIGGFAAPILGWRGAFFIAGAPGLLFAVIFHLTVREPARGMADGAPPAATQAPPFWSSLAQLWRIPSYRYVILAEAGFSFASYAQTIWLPSLLVRSHGMSLRSIGWQLGVTMVVAGAIGTIAGGAVGDRLAKRDQRLALILPVIAAIGGFPLTAAAALAPTGLSTLLIFGLSVALTSLQIGPLFALAQTTTPIGMRAMGISILILLTMVIGLGFGPACVGMLSDHLTSRFGADSLRDAMAAMSVFFLVPAVFCWLASPTLRRDIAAMNA